ncbi:copper homeostasis protein CutC [Pedobacter hiemivivus]|nr:copper homeostasis protein CutC [Pedobacter hiemivivus]
MVKVKEPKFNSDGAPWVDMEVCANSLRSALVAQEGGAIRVELCDNLHEGGTTPSYAQIAMAKKILDIDVFPIIRPRGGDFLYTDLEFELMKEDIKICKQLKCEGVVFGILKADGTVDEERCAELIALAGDMEVTFHRAFDRTRDLFEAMETIIKLGCTRILTSGGHPRVDEGVFDIEDLVIAANDRIIIMPGGGVSIENVVRLVKATKMIEFHASAMSTVPTEMMYKNSHMSEGSRKDLDYQLSDIELIKELIYWANNPM